MNWYQIGSLIWTGCGAAWLVLGIVTDLPECFLVGIGCIVVSALFNEMSKP